MMGYKIIVLAMAMCLVFGCLGGESKGNAAMDAFNASINRYIYLVNSTGDYSETIVMSVSNRTSDVSVSRHGSDYSVSLGSEFYAWTTIKKNGTEYLCLKFGNQTSCTANISVLGTSSSGISSSLSSVLLTKAQASQLSVEYNGLMEHNSLNITEFSNDSKGSAFAMRFSLKDLSGEELSMLYISPTSPLISVLSFNERMAFGESDGMRVFDSLDYTYLGQGYSESTNVTSFARSSSEIESPSVVNDTEFKALFYSFSQFWKAYNNVSSDTGMITLAMEYRMPELCRKTSNFSLCILDYMTGTKNPNACPLLSGSEKDQCWYYFGKVMDKKDPAYCERIANGTMKTDCLSNETAMNGTG
jgi:hypothetical protein